MRVSSTSTHEINALQTEATAGFNHVHETTLIASFVDDYFDMLRRIYDTKTNEMATNLIEGLYPALQLRGSRVDDGPEDPRALSRRPAYALPWDMYSGGDPNENHEDGRGVRDPGVGLRAHAHRMQQRWRRPGRRCDQRDHHDRGSGLGRRRA